MTEHDPAHDELVSAHLDGESTPEEAERIAREPLLKARLDTFASVRDAVRADVPALDEDERDALIARVLGASIAPTNVVSMSTWRRVQTRVVAVAAAVIAVAFLGGAIVLADRTSSEDQSASGDSGESATMSADSDLESSGTVMDGGGAPPAPDQTAAPGNYTSAQAIGLGSYPDADSLIERVRDELDVDDESAPTATVAPSSATTTAATAGEGSDRAAAAKCAPTDTERAYVADIDGRAVVVFVDRGTIRVLDAETCATVASADRG